MPPQLNQKGQTQMLRPQLFLVLLVASLHCSAQEVDLSVVSPEDTAKIQQALPAAARVQPAKQRKLLVFTLCRGFVHGSVPDGAVAFKLMGEKTGAFSTVISDDVSVFEPDSLKQFDAIVMDNTTGDLFATQGLEQMAAEEQTKAREREARLKQSFLDFVNNGGGLIGVHAATDCLYNWTEYGDMLGGYFSGHPWSEEVAVKLDDPGHTLCSAFKGQGFRINDEIYQFREPYSREKLRVLLSLDTSHTNMDKGEAIKRTDDDFAVSWVQSYGKGRVFYCSLGHRNEIFWTPSVLQFYLDGIQFALGDLPVDTTPSAQLTAEHLRDSRAQAFAAGVESLFGDLAKFELGGDAGNARMLDNLVVEAQQAGNAEKADVLVERLAGLLRADTTHDCKVLACRELRVIGTEKAVPALAALLTDEKLSDMARYALQSIPGAAADDALLAALPKTNGAAKVGIVNTLGARGTAKALPQLAALLADTDEALAAAAAAAVGELGDQGAAQALLAARGKAAGPVRLAVDQALLSCAGALVTAGGQQTAAQVYDSVYKSDAPAGIRAAAFHGLMLGRGEAAVPDVLTALKGERNGFAEAAARLVAELPGADLAATFAAALGDLPPATQPLVIDFLVERGDKRVAPAVLALAASPDEGVSLSAMRAMETLGDASAVLPLATAAAAAPDRSAARTQARVALERMGSAALNADMAKLVPTVAPPVRAELVRALGARKATNAVPELLRTAQDEDATVRQESLRALHLVSEPKDLPALLALLVQSDEGARDDLAETVVAVAHRLPEEADRPTAVLDALKKNVPADVRCSLLAALGQIAASPGLPTLYAALDDKDEDVQKTALKALADWPTPAPMDKLRDVSRASQSTVLRVLALRGYAKQLAMPADRSMKETLRLYQEALELAAGEPEKKSLLSGVGALRHPEAMKLLEPYLENKTYQAEALVAASQILEAMDGGAMTLTASRGEGDVRKAIDGDRGTRWTTGRPMAPDDWFEIDLGYDSDIEEIVLDAGDTGADYPRKYEVFISPDGENWGDPVVTGEGTEKTITIQVPPTHGRYVKLVQGGTAGGMFWSICELRVNGIPRLTGNGAELDRTDWKLTGFGAGKEGQEQNAIDGDPATRWSPGHFQRGDEWLVVDLGAERKILKVILDTKGSGGDYPRGYEVFVSNNGTDWIGPIAKGQGNSPVTSITVLPRTGRYLKIAQTGQTNKNFWSIHELTVLGE